MAALLNFIVTRLAEPARWLVVALIAYTLATTVLYFVSAPQSDVRNGADAKAPAGQASHAGPSQGPVDIDRIVARNLFGVADASAPVAAQPTAMAVATRLPLELQGVFVADAPKDSAAIVAQKGRPGMLYVVGQKMPGNAELVEVHSDHIVLRRAGVLETLKFPTATGQFVPAPQEPEDLADSARPITSPSAGEANTDDGRDERGRMRPTSESMAEYRERIEADPAGALADLGISAVNEGDASGYRLDDLTDSPFLSQTGLQPGDVILSVNGRPVGDINQDRMELDNVLAQGSARLEVQRGTRRFFVTASLP
jgi:general secretion pathway protein C